MFFTCNDFDNLSKQKLLTRRHFHDLQTVFLKSACLGSQTCKLTKIKNPEVLQRPNFSHFFKASPFKSRCANGFGIVFGNFWGFSMLRFWFVPKIFGEDVPLFPTDFQPVSFIIRGRAAIQRVIFIFFVPLGYHVIIIRGRGGYPTCCFYNFCPNRLSHYYYSRSWRLPHRLLLLLLLSFLVSTNGGTPAYRRLRWL